MAGLRRISEKAGGRSFDRFKAWFVDRLPGLARARARSESSSALERELAEAQRLARVGSWRWDLASKQIHWSQALFDIFGIEAPESTPTYDERRRLLVGDSLARLDAAIEGAREHGLAFSIDLEFLRCGSEPRTMTTSGEPVRDSSGRIIALRGTVQDVTEMRQIERALRISEQRFRAIFDSMFQFTGLLSPEGDLLEANHAALAFGGVQAAEVIGKRVWESLWWDQPVRCEQLRQAVLRAAQGEFVRYDAELQGTEERRITLDFSLKPVLDAEGKVAMLIAEGRDVTDERRARIALAESENRFRQAMRNAPIGKALVALDGRFIEVNEALCSMLGYTEPELLARTFQELTHADDLAADLALIEALIAGDCERYRMFKRYIRADGQVLDAQLDVSLMRNAAGAPLYFISQIQDVTERRRLEQQQEILTQRLSMALRVSGIGVWDFDVASGQFEIDDALYRIYGKKPGDATDYPAWRDAVLPEDFPRAEGSILAAIETKTSQASEFRIRHPKLGVRYLESAFGVVLDQNHKVVRLVGVNMDVTERWEAEQRIGESRALLRNLIDNLPVLISMVDPLGRFLVTNRRNATVMGLPASQIEGRSLSEVLPPQALERVAPAWQQVLAGETVEATNRFVEDGRVVHLQGVYLPITEGPQKGCGLAVFSDVTALKQAEAQLNQSNRRLEQQVAEVLKLQELLRDQATHDSLTGLYNRRYFDESLARELESARRQGYGLSLIMADLDHFKAVNDCYGHQAGDSVLQSWAVLMRDSMRSTDVLCRYGGEEFAIVMPRCSLEQAVELAEQLRLRLWKSGFSPNAMQGTISATVSLGVACAERGQGSPKELIRAADAALYRAKKLGRNRVVREPSDPGAEPPAL